MADSDTSVCLILGISILYLALEYMYMYILLKLRMGITTCTYVQMYMCILEGFLCKLTVQSQILFVLTGTNTTQVNCTTGSVRLADMITTNTTAEGRVEVCINQAWGTVCNRRFDDDDAGTVCVLAGGYSRSGN